MDRILEKENQWQLCALESKCDLKLSILIGIKMITAHYECAPSEKDHPNWKNRNIDDHVKQHSTQWSDVEATDAD